MNASSTRWRRPRTAEAIASVHASAACYRCSKGNGIPPVVVPELKLREVERQVLLGDVVVRADDPALEECPEAIEVRGVDVPAHVLAREMAHGLVRVAESAEMLVPHVLVRGDELHLVADGLLHEALQRRGVHMFNHLADHVTLAGDRTDDGRLVDVAGPTLSLPAAPGAAAVAILRLATDERLINFHDAHKPTEVGVTHGCPEPMAHVPGRLVRAGTDLPLNLLGADALLAVEHLPEHFEPRLDRVLGVLEDGAADDGEAVGVPRPALLVRALPVPRLGDSVDVFGCAAARAANEARRPAPLDQEPLAGVLAREGLHQLPEGHHDGGR